MGRRQLTVTMSVWWFLSSRTPALRKILNNRWLRRCANILKRRLYLFADMEHIYGEKPGSEQRHKRNALTIYVKSRYSRSWLVSTRPSLLMNSWRDITLANENFGHACFGKYLSGWYNWTPGKWYEPKKQEVNLNATLPLVIGNEENFISKVFHYIVNLHYLSFKMNKKRTANKTVLEICIES